MLLNCGVGEDSCEEIQPVHPQGNQFWIFIGRTDAKAPIVWPPDVKNWLLGKDPDAGKDWRQEKKGTTEDEMVGWHQRLNGHEFEQAPGDGEGQGSLACCSPWVCKELDITEWLNNNRRGSKKLKHRVCGVAGSNWALQQTLLTVPWYPPSFLPSEAQFCLGAIFPNFFAVKHAQVT